MYKDIRNFLIGSKQKLTNKIKEAKNSGNKIEWRNEIKNKKSLTNVLNYLNKDLSIKKKTAKERLQVFHVFTYIYSCANIHTLI